MANKLTSEDVIEKIGGFGRFQIRIIVLLGCGMFFANMVLMVMTFSTAEPPWKCSANSSACTLNGSFSPGDTNYNYRCNLSRGDWKFDIDGNFDSIVTEWDLVCDTAVYASLANSLTFLLWIFGSLTGSILGDKFGRKIIFYPLGLFTCVVGFISAFAQAYWVFAVFRALVGIGIGSSGIVGYVYVLEFIGKDHRGPVGIMIFIAWILCLCALSLLGYLIQSWRILSIVTSIPGALTIFFWFFTPESIRWLMVKGKMKQAKKVIKLAANLNKRRISEEDLSLLGEEQDDNNKGLGNIRSLFSSRSMVYRTLASWYCWFACAMVYYGITLSSPTIGGNMYLNFFVSAMCELGGMFISLPCLKYLGRKKTMIISLWLSGVVGLAAALLSHYDNGSKGFLAGKILMSMVLGKFFITIAFDVIYLYSSELFPTAVRGTAMGTSTSAGRIGSAVSPYIVFSKRAHTILPFAIMAGIAAIGGVICMTLPETLGKSLTDTVQEADKNSNQANDQLIDTPATELEARA